MVRAEQRLALIFRDRCVATSTCLESLLESPARASHLTAGEELGAAHPRSRVRKLEPRLTAECLGRHTAPLTEPCSSSTLVVIAYSSMSPNVGAQSKHQ